MNIDGTTARFKLTKEDWDRIPINTFPSGGRLLSGDWTRIFLSKVKESNPWCSLRFKNNHVRSENSRKMHSAVFFRGGAECKRPECNVKVRFVIQKERGKYVDVTYVGNVCHSSEPGGGDAMTDKRRVKRVRRTYSSWNDANASLNKINNFKMLFCRRPQRAGLCKKLTCLCSKGLEQSRWSFSYSLVVINCQYQM